MKYWTGYLTAAIFAAFAWALGRLGRSLSTLVDAVYPYITRSMQSILAQWTGTVDFCVWQVVLIVLAVIVLATIVLMIVFRWNPIQWLGWVLAVCSILFCAHTALWGLNHYAAPLAQDIRLQSTDLTVSDMEKATVYYRNQADALAQMVERDENGNVRFADFETLAVRAADGFYNLTYVRKQPVFAGSRVPVKKLAWGDAYNAMGISGITMPLTGECAVNPKIPAISLPFTMCREMAHRMSIASQRDASFAAFLACSENPDNQFRYSAYFMAYRYCYNALASIEDEETAQAAAKIKAEESQQLSADLAFYDEFFKTHRDDKAAKAAEKANDVYLTASGSTEGTQPHEKISDLLVDWYIQEVVMPSQEEQEIVRFDPTEVDLSVTLPTEPEETTEETAGEE